jgi:hypothetical protein
MLRSRKFGSRPVEGYAAACREGPDGKDIQEEEAEVDSKVYLRAVMYTKEL